jgi:hypothetical protein
MKYFSTWVVFASTNTTYFLSLCRWTLLILSINSCWSTGCPTRYLTRQFFNNFTTNEDIATKSEADLPHCVRNVKEKNVLLFKFLCNIFIIVKIIKEMPGSVASGTLCIIFHRHLVEILDLVWLWTAPTARLLLTCRDSELFLSSDQDFFRLLDLWS